MRISDWSSDVCSSDLLDTPGHQDFSEDTYRVLTAVDAALMVIDAANGVEPQTIRLLQVCRARNTPIITFINKMDREVREPLELLSEIEGHLRSEEHTSELQSLMRNSYAVFCLNKNIQKTKQLYTQMRLQ